MRMRTPFSIFAVFFFAVFLLGESAHAGRRFRPFARSVAAVGRVGVFAGRVAIRTAAGVTRVGARTVLGAARISGRVALGTARVGAFAVGATVRLGAGAAIGTARIARGAARLSVGLPAIPPQRQFTAFSAPIGERHDGGGPSSPVAMSSARPLDETGFPANANFRMNVGAQTCLATFLGTDPVTNDCKALIQGSCLGLSPAEARTIDGQKTFALVAGSEIGLSSLRGRAIERTAVVGATTSEVKFACSAEEVANLSPVSLDLALEFQKLPASSR